MLTLDLTAQKGCTAVSANNDYPSHAPSTQARDSSCKALCRGLELIMGLRLCKIAWRSTWSPRYIASLRSLPPLCNPQAYMQLQNSQSLTSLVELQKEKLCIAGRGLFEQTYSYQVNYLSVVASASRYSKCQILIGTIWEIRVWQIQDAALVWSLASSP